MVLLARFSLAPHLLRVVKVPPSNVLFRAKVNYPAKKRSSGDDYCVCGNLNGGEGWVGGRYLHGFNFWRGMRIVGRSCVNVLDAPLNDLQQPPPRHERLLVVVAPNSFLQKLPVPPPVSLNPKPAPSEAKREPHF